MKNRLLPEPKNCRRTGGFLSLPHSLYLVTPADSSPPTQQAAAGLQDWIRNQFKRPVAATNAGAGPRQARGVIRLTVSHTGAAEGYELAVGPRDIEVSGNDETGLFYGLQTLRQLLRVHRSPIPCLRIRDEPAFRHRGLYLDISRGRVPHLATLKSLVERMAALKMNQLQLYVEHVFDFAFDPAIGAGCDPLRAPEIRELDRFCRAQHVELVPSLACFGHMGRILSLPRYRTLAEVEWPCRDWESASWRMRLRGATLNPRLEASRRLIRNLLDEYLPLFSSGRFNMCGDETYDLGRGANAAFVRRRGLAALYLQHLRFVRGVARKHGKQLMFWGDMMQQYPEGIPGIPADCIALDWGYGWDTHFEKAARFMEAGLETYVCPSTRGFKVVFNEIEEARANIAGYARAGCRLGAAGLLVTDWGDIGHFNLPGCSCHGLALGAALGWNPSSDEGDGFDHAFSLQCLGDPSGRAAARLVRAGTTGLAEWPLLIQDPPRPTHSAAARRQARKLGPKCRRWSAQISRMSPTDWLSSLAIREMALGCEALALNTRRILIEPDLRTPAKMTAAAQKRIEKFCSELELFFRKYAQVWRQAYQPAGLRDLERAFKHAVLRLRQAAAGNTEGRLL